MTAKMKKRDARPLYESKKYLTRNEAARILGTTTQTIANYIQRGLLIENNEIGGARTPRLYSSSVRTLIKDGYDVLEQQKAIERARLELKKEAEEVDELQMKLRQSRDRIAGKILFHNYLDRLKKVLLALLSSNDDLPKRSKEIMNDLLDGESFSAVASRHHITYQRASQIFNETVKKLKENDFPSRRALENRNKRLHCKVMSMKKVLAEIKDLDADRVYPLPKILIGRENLYKLFSVRSANALSLYGVENAYELALIRPKEIKLIRNLGEGSFREIRNKMASMGIVLGEMSSLRNPKIKSIAEKNYVLLDEIIYRRQALSKRK